MKEVPERKLKHLILTAFLFFSTVTLATAASRSTCPAFGAKSINAISRNAILTNRQPQFRITLHYEITVIRVFTVHRAWAFCVGVGERREEMPKRLVFPVPFRLEHGTLKTEHILITITHPTARKTAINTPVPHPPTPTRTALSPSPLPTKRDNSGR